MGRTATCRYHCCGCGAHFSSLRGFDEHLGGSQQHGIYCREVYDVKTLAVASEHGVCRLSGGDPILDAVIFTDADSFVRRRRWGAKVRRSPASVEPTSPSPGDPGSKSDPPSGSPQTLDGGLAAA